MPADPLATTPPLAAVQAPDVLAWRLRRHLLVEPDPTVATCADVADRLGGMQAQVPGCAREALALRLRRDVEAELSADLAAGRLLRTWAARGTLHLLTPAAAADQLALLASARTWLKGTWQRTFATAAQMDRLAEVVPGLLAGPPLTRAALTAAVLDATGDDALTEHLRSGWATLLKPLAWQGMLCQAPAGAGTQDGDDAEDDGGRVRFTRPDLLVPDWRPAPVEEAGPRVVRAYLGAYGPARPDAFAAWLLRSALPKATVARWFASLAEAGELAVVDVDGERRWALAMHMDELRGAAEGLPGEPVLLPAFDPYVLGPGTADPMVVPQGHRALVSRAGGWISAVVLEGGRVAGVWSGSRESPLIERFAAEPNG